MTSAKTTPLSNFSPEVLDTLRQRMKGTGPVYPLEQVLDELGVESSPSGRRDVPRMVPQEASAPIQDVNP